MPEPIGQVLAEIADKSQKLMHALAERRYARNGSDGSSDPLNLRPTLLELTRAPDGRSGAADPGPARALAGLPPAVAEHRPAAAGSAGAAGGRARAGRSPVPRSGLGRSRAVRLHQAVLPADRALAGQHGQPARRPRREEPAEDRLLHAPVRRCHGADQFRRDQSRGAAGDAGDRRRESAARSQQPARRPRPRRGQARDQDDRSRRLRARPRTSH